MFVVKKGITLGKHKLTDFKRQAYSFHSPTFIMMTLITLGPLLYSIYISFFDFRLSNPAGKTTFVGLQNYIEVFAKPEALASIWTTFIFMLMAVSVEVVVAVALALALNSLLKLRKFFTSCVIIPMMVAPLVVGLMYSFFMNPQFGLYPFLVRTMHLPLPTAPLTDPKLALAVVALTDAWEWTPYLALTFLAGLQSIPRESYEAAKIDGAGGVQTFLYVTVPLMRPVFVVGLVLRAMEAFKEFDKPFILTGGGPGAVTEVIDMYAYRQAFVSFNFSYAAAVCVVLFSILLVGGMLYGKFVMERGNHDY